MMVNLNANAAGGASPNMVPACEECHPSPFTLMRRENDRLRGHLQTIRDAVDQKRISGSIPVAGELIPLRDWFVGILEA